MATFDLADLTGGGGLACCGVRAEARQVRSEGTEVVLIEPKAADLALIGSNPLRTAARHAVLEQAVRSVRSSLRDPELRACLGELPQGDPRRVRRPADATTAWAEILASRRRTVS